MLTYEDCPDVAAHEERALIFAATRFGDRKTMGRRQAVDYIRKGWGVGSFATIAEIERAFDAAVSQQKVAYSHTASFRVSYLLPPGASVGGSSYGSHPLSCPMFTRDSVHRFAQSALIRFACRLDTYSHVG